MSWCGGVAIGLPLAEAFEDRKANVLSFLFARRFVSCFFVFFPSMQCARTNQSSSSITFPCSPHWIKANLDILQTI